MRTPARGLVTADLSTVRNRYGISQFPNCIAPQLLRAHGRPSRRSLSLSARRSAAEHRSDTAEECRKRSLPKDPPIQHGDDGDDGQQPPERRRVPVMPRPPDREGVSGRLQEHRDRLVPGERERPDQKPDKPQPEGRRYPARQRESEDGPRADERVRPQVDVAEPGPPGGRPRRRPSRKSDIQADPSRTAPSVTRRAPRTGISATATTSRASVSASAASPTRSRSSGRAAPCPSMSRA
jgi:hypothetical protein